MPESPLFIAGFQPCGLSGTLWLPGSGAGPGRSLARSHGGGFYRLMMILRGTSTRTECGRLGLISGTAAEGDAARPTATDHRATDDRRGARLWVTTPGEGDSAA